MLSARYVLVIPKVHSAEDVKLVHDIIEHSAHTEGKENIRIIASIESARAIMNLREVCRLPACWGWQSDTADS